MGGYLVLVSNYKRTLSVLYIAKTLIAQRMHSGISVNLWLLHTCLAFLKNLSLIH